MTKQELIKKAGSRPMLATLLGVSLAAISQWETVPEARLWQARVLRPDWFEGEEKNDKSSDMCAGDGVPDS
jgi:hypothetical protein